MKCIRHGETTHRNAGGLEDTLCTLDLRNGPGEHDLIRTVVVGQHDVDKTLGRFRMAQVALDQLLDVPPQRGDPVDVYGEEHGALVDEVLVERPCGVARCARDHVAVRAEVASGLEFARRGRDESLARVLG